MSKAQNMGMRSRSASGRRFWVIILVLLILAAIIAVPWLFWLNAPELPLRIAIMDKTVPFPDRREHKGLFWALVQNKLIDPDDTLDEDPADTDREEKRAAGVKEDKDARFYNYISDYVGSFPGDDNPNDGDTENKKLAGSVDPEQGKKPEEHRFKEASDNVYIELTAADLANRDTLWICDTYGVYHEDYHQFKQDYAHTMHNPKYFGGLAAGEMDAIEGWLAQPDKLMVCEFNTFGSPTEEGVRHRMESVLGVKWTEWIGRYFLDFQDRKDVPQWFYDIWKKEHGGEDFKEHGPGFLFCRNESQEYIVLLDEEDVDQPEGMWLIPNENYTEDDVLKGLKTTHYNYWFDICDPVGDVEVLADYKIHVTEEGRQKLAAHGLKPDFPAIFRKSAGYTAYYLAGEYLDFNKPMGDPKTRLTPHINRNYFSKYVQGGQGQFFWHTSYPLVCNILLTQSNRINGEPEEPLKF